MIDDGLLPPSSGIHQRRAHPVISVVCIEVRNLLDLSHPTAEQRSGLGGVSFDAVQVARHGGYHEKSDLVATTGSNEHLSAERHRADPSLRILRPYPYSTDVHRAELEHLDWVGFRQGDNDGAAQSLFGSHCDFPFGHALATDLEVKLGKHGLAVQHDLRVTCDEALGASGPLPAEADLDSLIIVFRRQNLERGTVVHGESAIVGVRQCQRADGLAQ
mmetsp:Transcript_96808/g.278515  ORF Transcript_96808/g.278515 Transcript_96808/m.278515 type:complete len:217 (-) Transcript_96808:273-923(-)